METIIETNPSKINWNSKEPFLVKLNRESVELIVLVDVENKIGSFDGQFAGTVIHEKDTNRYIGEYATDFSKALFTKFEGTITIKQ